MGEKASEVLATGTARVRIGKLIRILKHMLKRPCKMPLDMRNLPKPLGSFWLELNATGLMVEQKMRLVVMEVLAPEAEGAPWTLLTIITALKNPNAHAWCMGQGVKVRYDPSTGHADLMAWCYKVDLLTDPEGSFWNDREAWNMVGQALG